MAESLNPWLASVLRKAERLYEDADRVYRAAPLFTATIRRVQKIATHSAIRCPEPWPDVERFQPDEGSPVLSLEWYDQSAGWHLYFHVRRAPGVKPFVTLDFYGNPTHYSIDKPTDEEIARALYDYFEAWKREGAPARSAQ